MAINELVDECQSDLGHGKASHSLAVGASDKRDGAPCSTAWAISRDINIRNINLNSRFGFELEGVFLDEIKVGDKRQDVVRMALFKPLWLQIFSPGG